MEADFEGDMYDIPEDKKQEEEKQDEDGEEELEREMGDDSDPNEQVIDEKMWDEDDEDPDGDENEESEKFEKDSKLSGESEENELRTKEDDENEKQENEKQENGQQKEEKDSNNNMDDEQKTNDADESSDDPVNDDLEENYEERHEGVDIRQEEQKDGSDEENDMDLGDELDLDDNDKTDDGDEATIGENMDIDDIDDGEDNDESKPEEAMSDEEDNEGFDENEALPASAHTGGEEVDQNNEDDDKEEDDDSNDEGNFDLDLHTPQVSREDEAHGVAAKSGQDSIKKQDQEEEPEEEEEEKEDGKGDENNDNGNSQEDDNSNMDDGQGDDDDGEGNWQDGEGNQGDSPPGQKPLDLPNPFRDPGDAEKFWHKKLKMKEDSLEENHMEDEGDEENNNVDEDINTNGMFEFAAKTQSSSAQVLGEAAEVEDDTLEAKDDENEIPNENESVSEAKKEFAETEETVTEKKTGQDRSKKTENSKGNTDKKYEESPENVEEKSEENEHEINDTACINNDKENKIVTDISQLNVQEDDSNFQVSNENIVENDEINNFNSVEALEARHRWSKIQSETNVLSRRLCEKLRLVMEPLVATKLRGDYRTGKRINMKRVIGYIASGYQKDKIWLRRTKPAKRNYRVLLAVDNSESMKKSGAGDMALSALATLANGMSQLEVGELGIASFGEDMKLLHPFNLPFTSESGANVVCNFKFDDQRTRTALCVESAIVALESQAESSSSLQLVFIISDGRIERDSRQNLRKLVREMSERNILVVMMIVEGKQGEGSQKKDSIIQMKEVTFEKGKPKMKHFIDDYPFPYYMVLEDMNSLPEVLGDALRQWFEMLSQIQNPNSS
eukprot:CAMPEP_0197826570 /NCGR_PEP_ID=MMETSP1437-20131217/3511_1 /TAXON_ID=49252 ORGANISM="Eucampia antarctica, Strain CCMP1452" /NCGR_SAMPLE_ID=MMETSP1437 /ASSEMBLY_ACC=CAM_ASM_001096 /LENGTH=844 /DNA_ID=CAMNT_0043427063 /DNA_START=1 /DNA_END=2535 /DNA_ORIENTATION=-